jgi:hypothetical protein
MWLVGSGLMLLWLFLKFVLHKGGFVHILLLTSITLFVIQFAADRKARYQKALDS